MSQTIFVKRPANTILTANADTDLNEGKKTLRIEAAALEALAKSLDYQFTEVIDLLANIKGRIIVSGMGNSGHIGRKIAATFASTGSPAFFVHPAEASHGDLGMLTKDDAVILISNSGESAELKDILAFCKRFRIPIIGFTSKPESTLGEQSDYFLRLMDMDEACPTGKVPTTSTTMSLALGDALAVTLMKRNGFTGDDFKVFHPGGKLGQQLMRVSDVMRDYQELPLIKITADMGDALMAMSENNFGRAIIVDKNGHLAGFISDGDIRRNVGDDLVSKPVTDIMSKNPKCVEKSDLAVSALTIMNENQITDLIVTDERKPIGLLRLHDILKAGIV